MTGKLTTPEDFKPKSQIEAEKKLQAKLEKQRIRDELLKPDPVTDFDTKLYSDYLGTKSEKSKSANELNDEIRQRELIK